MFIGAILAVLFITLSVLWAVLWYGIEQYDVIPLFKGERRLKNGEVVVVIPPLIDHELYRVLNSKDYIGRSKKHICQYSKERDLS